VSELQQLLDHLVAAGAPGAAGWVRNERGSLGAASGLANRRTRQPMRPELRFRAGSMTKSLVAAVVLRLAAEGRLSLEDPLERWLPGSLRYGDRVSLRHLLNHTGGVPSPTATLEQALYASRSGRLRAWTPQALVAMVADQPPAFPAGAAWSYSNTGYVLLGLVVEAASQRTLDQELDRSILTPLGMRDTLLPDSAPEIPGPSARGYSLPLGPQGEALDGPLLDFTVQNPSWAGAAGALVSTLPDLTRFFRALLGGRLLPPPLLAEMTTMVEVPSGSIPLPLYDRYGLGLLEVETPAGPLLGMVGGIPGFLSIVLSTPDGRRQFGLMINALLAPAPVHEAFIQGSRALGSRLLS
jgi:D-alanyl-D-alanine carboxypeptidase